MAERVGEDRQPAPGRLVDLPFLERARGARCKVEKVEGLTLWLLPE